MTSKKELNNILKEEVIEIKDYLQGVNRENKKIEDRIACVKYIQMCIDTMDEAISEYKKSEIVKNVINR